MSAALGPAAPAHQTLAAIERRGRAMRVWCDRVRARGGRAVTEEDCDLPKLRHQWRTLRARLLVTARLDELGPTPVNAARVRALRRAIAARDASRRT
jgi:hypothetical protein